MKNTYNLFGTFLLLCCLFSFSWVHAQDPADPGSKTIMFVSPDNDKDNEQINWLRALGFTVTKYYHSALSTAPAEEIEALNAADLVIVGRAVSTDHFGRTDRTTGPADRAAWNGLTTPLILNSQWAARENRLNWFDNPGNPATFNPSEPEVLNAKILAPEDEAFEGVTIGDGDLLPWLNSPDNLIYTSTAPNGVVLAESVADAGGTRDAGAMLMVRFEADTEFYEGTTDAPAGPRTYFGFGADVSGTSYYFTLTQESLQVYLNEINRILGTDVEMVAVPDATLADLQVDGNTIPGFAEGTFTYNFVLSEAGDVTISATPTEESSTVVMNGADASGVVTVPAEGTSVEVLVTAADGETTETYTINFTVTEPLNPDEQTIVFITNSATDDEHIELLESAGHNVITYFNASLGTASQADIDMLNSASLIIIGRAISTNHLGNNNVADKQAWNNLTTPLIMVHQWGARSNRLNWFNNVGNPAVHNPEEAEVINAEILAPNDVAFEGLTLENDNILPWLHTPENLLYASTPPNGRVLAVTPAGAAGNEAGGAMLFVRFAAGTEFYRGAGDAPAGPRTYLGFGADVSGTSYYFQLTEEAQAVYLNEVERMLNIADCPPTDITMHHQVTDADGNVVGDWNAGELTATIDAGQGIVFGPHPSDVETGWSWTGPGNFSADTREIEFPASEGGVILTHAGDYVATFTNECGNISTATFSLTVNVPDPGTDPTDPDPKDPEEVNIIFISTLGTGSDELTQDGREDDQVQWLRDQGFNVEVDYVSALATDQAAATKLNAADLVIVGRGSTSGDFTAANGRAWNALTVPLITNSPYVARTSRFNWFATNEIPKIRAFGDEAIMINVNIEDPTDPAFTDVTLGDNNTLEWMLTPNDILINPSIASYGEVLATVNNPDVNYTGAILYARFRPGTEFYAGAGEVAAGTRVYFGFGNDDNNAEGPGVHINHFFSSLTDVAKQVYLNEIKSLVGVPLIEQLAKASAPTPAHNATGLAAGTTTLSWQGNAETYNLYWGTEENNLELVGEALTEATFSAEDVQAGTTYFWRVDALDGEESMEGDVWSFATAASTEPLAKVNNMVPANDAMVGLDDLILSWEGNADTYDVYMGTTQNNLAIVGENISENTYTPENLVANQLYFWRVDARRADLTETGDVVNFTTTATTGFPDLASQGVTIYPNPLAGNGELFLSNAEDLVSVSVYTAQGMLVKTVNGDNSATLTIPVSELAKGLYLLKAVKKDRSVLSGKVVKN